MKFFKSKYGFWTILIIFILFIVLGVGMMFYPIIAVRYSESVQSEIQTSYEEIIKEVDTTQIDALRNAAMKYNADLASGVFSHLEYKENGYYDQLTLPNTDIMCFISIPKIGVYLPVYHGVSDEALDRGAGHMEQTSLPVGGTNTHAVISAHTGMAQNPMFTDLELLEEGDIFQIKVLGEILTYEVFDIQVVLPQVVDATRIQTGEDLVSLITCTPYGVNSHRLIVQGKRIQTPSEQEVPQLIERSTAEEKNESVWTQKYWHSVKLGGFIALLLLLLVLIIFTISRLVKNRKKKNGSYEI